MILQPGQSAFTLASKRGLSCSSYRVVLVSGSSRAIVPLLSDPAAFCEPPPPLGLPPPSSPPHAAAPAPSASAASTHSALLRFVLILTPSPRGSHGARASQRRTVC